MPVSCPGALLGLIYIVYENNEHMRIDTDSEESIRIVSSVE
jgi:hypothetical protein